jgi:hypothetical protein
MFACVLFSFLMYLGTGCTPLTPREEAFVALSYGDQVSEIMAAEPNERIDLFLLAYGMRPQNAAAMWALAEFGGEIVPEVTDRLRESNVRDTRYYIDLLIAIETKKSYCVSCDDEVMSGVHDAVLRIGNDTLRSESRDKVRRFLRKQN